jgi:hypothetical protein
VLHRSASALLLGRERAEAIGIGGAVVVNGVLNGAVTGVQEGIDYSRLKRGQSYGGGRPLGSLHGVGGGRRGGHGTAAREEEAALSRRGRRRKKRPRWIAWAKRLNRPVGG